VVALNEVAIHGWDLARATGQDYELPSEIVEVLLEFDGQDADDQASRDGSGHPHCWKRSTGGCRSWRLACRCPYQCPSASASPRTGSPSPGS
jgi:hypothetical protein